MPSFSIRLGDTIPLNLQLFDGDTTKYVRAIVRDPTDVEITGSPFTLPHVGDGLYKLYTEAMPNVDYLISTYQVFDDAGFTSKSELHSDATDIFLQAFPIAETIEILNLVNDMVQNGVISKGIADVLIGSLVDNERYVGHINDASLVGRVDDADLVGSVSDSALEGSISSSVNTTGEVKTANLTGTKGC